MEYNAIITGLDENQNENLPLLVQNLFYARSRNARIGSQQCWNHQTLQTRRSKDN